MPASFVQKWVIPTIRARNALNGHGTKLPGGYETAMLFSIFDQSILDTTKSRQQLDDDDHALRAIVACAQDANIKLIERMRTGNDGLKGAVDFRIKCSIMSKCYCWKVILHISILRIATFCEAAS